MKTTVWTVEENSTTWVDGFDRSSLPYQVSKAIRVVSDGSRCALEVGGVVGTVPLIDGTLLRVRPKVGEYNFARMMLRADGLYGDLKYDLDRLSAYSVNDSPAPIWVVCRALCRSLAEISRNSRTFQRTSQVVRGTFAAGRLFPLETAENLASRVDNPVVYERKTRDYDTPEHRVLGKAADIALRLLPTGELSLDVESAVQWKRYAKSFSIADLAHISKKLMGHKYGGPRGYYANALALARIILGDVGFSSDNLALELDGDGFLVDSAQLFERFIRAVLVDCHKASGIIVTKGGGVRNQALYLDGNFELVPDYVYQQREAIRLIADAKYKRPDSSDHYQMICYLTRYRVSTGVFFMPEYDGATIEPVRHITPDRLAVWEVPLPLSNLDKAEALLSSALERFGGH